ASGSNFDLKFDLPPTGMQVFDGVDYKASAAATAAAQAASSQGSSRAAEAIAFLKSISESAKASQNTSHRRARNISSKYAEALQNEFGTDDNNMDFGDDYYLDEDNEDNDEGFNNEISIASRISKSTQRVALA